jgi:tRNA (mo5U34)-methyltransferase
VKDLASRVAQYHWHHSIDLGHGVVTKGAKPPHVINAEADVIFDRLDLAGRSVLDVGAWNGFFSFEAKRRGAARVLATDSFRWSLPESRGRESFELAREALGLEVEAQEIDVADMDPAHLGQFDVVLYLGVFYHRYDAIEALAKVARLARHLLIVETHLDMRKVDRPAMVFYPGSEYLNDPTTWWGPNERCIEALLRGQGFSEVEIAAHPTLDTRGIFHAWRSTELRRQPLPDSLRLKSVIYDTRTKIVRELKRTFRRMLGGHMSGR